jgi:hypothetical protein
MSYNDILLIEIFQDLTLELLRLRCLCKNWAIFPGLILYWDDSCSTYRCYSDLCIRVEKKLAVGSCFSDKKKLEWKYKMQRSRKNIGFLFCLGIRT